MRKKIEMVRAKNEVVSFDKAYVEFIKMKGKKSKISNNKTL